MVKRVVCAALSILIIAAMTACGDGGGDKQTDQQSIVDIQKSDEVPQTQESNQPEEPEPPSMVITTDFFSDEARQNTYEKAYESQNFQAVLDAVNQYISQNDTVDTDSAYEIINLAQPAADAMKNCVVEKDDFEGTYLIYYKGVQEISDSVAVVPTSYHTERGGKIGFYAQDWLFFDRLQIKVDDSIIFDADFDSDEKITEVISGGRIYEGIDCSNYQIDYAAIGAAQTASIRFENTETGKHIDHMLSAAEIKACASIELLCQSYRNLSDLMFAYNNPKK